MSFDASIEELASRVKAAARVLATVSTETKNNGLLTAADLLEQSRESLLEANQVDLQAASASGMSDTLMDRLRLSDSRLDAMAAGLRKVAALNDPVGEVVSGWEVPSGLRISQVRVPLGVVAIVYESRPNVTSDAAALCLKSSNAAFLRGSSSAVNSNLAIAEVMRQAYEKSGLPSDALILLADTSYEAAVEFMQLRDTIDCLIPRGGPGLISSILENATVPYVIDGDGNCHVYVDASADLDMARRILVNAKTQRPSVCNAAESLVLHSLVAAELLPLMADDLADVELVGDEQALAILGSERISLASEADFSTEFLTLKLSVKVVDSLDEAIAHVNATGSGHSEAIVTSDLDAADRFCKEVDAAAVLVNTSTRFVDGEEFGFGAEIGISTQKLHARGPMGLRQLTTTKYVVRGQGQIRE
ncbi:MAG: glutamate-5-semialdehyde dehydrogenase [Acidimicrobiia bacterium]|nr:glutamate-5-semialdehyde dehydrogenase [Acidimicrobiia bacterium]MYC58124.1 glutamate-5-semialdehyde dehydrogenase [Acidimicrobiia bacterium]MYI30556.1 glutamate-5-semialdehyde dehydrogenase [Acidimicrobiia bacterium]